MLFGDPGDNAITESVIGSAIEVHRELGPGVLEGPCETALTIELGLRGHQIRRQVPVPLFYKGVPISNHRIDLIVDDRIIVEVKCVTRLEPVHTAQLITYLRATRLRIGLLINFNEATIRRGIRRVMV
jgi:GxxExxY protein